MRNSPDGFIGAVMAIEGIDDGTVVLHGQNGCRKGLLISQKLNPRPERLHLTESQAYRGCRTVPYSGIVAGDYSGVSASKLTKVLKHVADEDYGLVSVMCSPGVSILGDDCNRALAECGISDRGFVMDCDNLGADPWTGFDRAIVAVLEHLKPAATEIRRATVNILGLSIMHKDWSVVKNEVAGILAQMGLEVVCCLGAGCTSADIRKSFNAQYNLVLDPDYSQETIRFYESFGIQTITIGHAPVGFDAVLELIAEIGRRTERDISCVMPMLNAYRRRAYECIIASGKSLSGKSFHVELNSAQAKPLSKWLCDSFAMCESEDADYVFCDGMTSRFARKSKRTVYVDAGFPSPKVDFVPSPIMGMHGAMYILDSIFR